MTVWGLPPSVSVLLLSLTWLTLALADMPDGRAEPTEKYKGTQIDAMSSPCFLSADDKEEVEQIVFQMVSVFHFRLHVSCFPPTAEEMQRFELGMEHLATEVK